MQIGNVGLLWGVVVSSFFFLRQPCREGRIPAGQPTFLPDKALAPTVPVTEPSPLATSSQSPGKISEILDGLPPPHTSFQTLQLDTSLIAQNSTKPVGGRTTLFILNWAKLTQDQRVLATVQGYELPLNQWPTQRVVPTHRETNQVSVLLEEVQRLAHSPSTGSTDPPSQPYVCCPEKRGRVETDHRSQIPEFLPRTPSFQDGGPLHVTHHPETPLGDGQDRSQRCLSDHPSGPETSLSVVVQGTHRAEDAIQLPTLWTLHRTLCVYKGHKANSAVSETARSPLNNVSGRLAPGSSKPVTITNKPFHNTVDVHRFGICDQSIFL